MSAPQTVELGGEDSPTIVTLERPTGYKGKYFVHSLMRVFAENPQVDLACEKWAREMGKARAIEVTPERAERHIAITATDPQERQEQESRAENFRALLARYATTPEDIIKRGYSFLIPQPPTGTERWLYKAPQLYLRAEDEINQLLAVFTIPNDELKAAKRAGALDSRISQAVDLIDDSELEQLKELALSFGVAVVGVLQKMGMVDEELDLKKVVEEAFSKVTQQTRETSLQMRLKQSENESAAAPSPSTNTSPSSSIPSPVATAGPPTTSSST